MKLNVEFPARKGESAAGALSSSRAFSLIRAIAAALAVLLAVFGLAALRWGKSQPGSVSTHEIPQRQVLTAASAQPRDVVVSRPLQPGQLLLTASPQTLSTDSLPGPSIVRSSRSSLVIIETPLNAAVATVSDSELLASFPSQPVLLARLGPGRQTFIVLASPTP